MEMVVDMAEQTLDPERYVRVTLLPVEGGE